MADQSLIEVLRSELDLPVFVSGVGLTAVFVLLVATMPTRVDAILSQTSEFLLQTFGAFFQGTTLLAIGFLALLAGPWGQKTLGDPDVEPVFGFWTYFSMVFTAGIAAGIVFWGSAEAILHYDTVPPVVDADSRSSEAVVGALQVTIFHWGLSAWSAYFALGLPIGYFVYNRNAPLRVSAILTPVFGPDGHDGVVGRAIDVLAVVATLGGMTATIGLVSEQFLTGLEYEWGIQLGDGAVIIFMCAVVLVFTISVVTGLHRGIRRISMLTVGGFISVGVLIFILGPSGYIVEVGSAALLASMRQFVPMSTMTGGGWSTTWTLYYWSWWFSWAPFVSLFIARISKGRTIREVVSAGVIAPTLATTAWFLVVGGTAIGLQRKNGRDILGVISESGSQAAAFPLFDALVFGDALLLLFLGLIIVFLVTSADSSTLSIAFLTTPPDMSPSARVKFIWGIVQAVLASVVIVAGGGQLLRSAAVLTGGPIALLALIAMGGMLASLGPLTRHRD